MTPSASGTLGSVLPVLWAPAASSLKSHITDFLPTTGSQSTGPGTTDFWPLCHVELADIQGVAYAIGCSDSTISDPPRERLRRQEPCIALLKTIIASMHCLRSPVSLTGSRASGPNHQI